MGRIKPSWQIRATCHPLRPIPLPPLLQEVMCCSSLKSLSLEFESVWFDKLTVNLSGNDRVLNKSCHSRPCFFIYLYIFITFTQHSHKPHLFKLDFFSYSAHHVDQNEAIQALSTTGKMLVVHNLSTKSHFIFSELSLHNVRNKLIRENCSFLLRKIPPPLWEQKHNLQKCCS